MKRTDITDLFPDATEEQVNKLMNLHGADLNAAKKGVTELQGQLADAQADLQKLKADPSQAEDLSKQLKALQKELAGMKRAEEVRLVRERIAGEKKVPAALLTGEDEAACTAQADALIAWRGDAAPKTPNYGVDHLLGSKPGTGGSEINAALAELRDGLFQNT